MGRISKDAKTTLHFRKAILGEMAKQNPLRFGAASFLVPFEDSEEHIRELLVSSHRDGSPLCTTREQAQFLKYCGRWEVRGPAYFDKNFPEFRILEPKMGFLRNGSPAFVFGTFVHRQKDSGIFNLAKSDFPRGRQFLVKMLAKARDGLFQRFEESPEFIPDFLTSLQSYWKASGASSGYFNHGEMKLFTEQLKNLDFTALSNLNQVSKAIDRTGFHIANQKGLSTLIIQVVMALGLTREEFLEDSLRFILENKKRLHGAHFNLFKLYLANRKFGEKIVKIYKKMPAKLQD